MFPSKNEDASILTNMGDFVHSWVYRKSHKQPANIIGDVSLADHDHVKCDGAVSLKIATIISVYLMCFVHGCVAQVESFKMLCDVMEMLTNLKCDALGRITPELLRDTINAHLKAFQKAYKGLGWRPKDHWAYHLWYMFKKCGCLLGLLVTERRHKIVK